MSKGDRSAGQAVAVGEMGTGLSWQIAQAPPALGSRKGQRGLLEKGYNHP